jgi:hypothetical protein
LQHVTAMVPAPRPTQLPCCCPPPQPSCRACGEGLGGGACVSRGCSHAVPRGLLVGEGAGVAALWGGPAPLDEPTLRVAHGREAGAHDARRVLARARRRLAVPRLRVHRAGLSQPTGSQAGAPAPCTRPAAAAYAHVGDGRRRRAMGTTRAASSRSWTLLVTGTARRSAPDHPAASR